MKEQYSKLASKALKLAENTAKRCSHNALIDEIYEEYK